MRAVLFLGALGGVLYLVYKLKQNKETYEAWVDAQKNSPEEYDAYYAKSFGKYYDEVFGGNIAKNRTGQGKSPVDYL